MPNIPPEDLAFLKQQGLTDDQIAQIQPVQQQLAGITQTIGDTIKAHLGSYIGGGAGTIGGGAATGALLGSEVPGIGNLIGAVVGGLGGAYLGQKGQQAVESPDTYDAQQAQAQADAQQNPITAGATDIAASALGSGGMFSPKTAISGLRGIIGKLGGADLTDDAKNVIAQSLINPAIGTGVSLAQGQGIPSIGDLGTQALGGALFAKSWLPHGRLGDEGKPEAGDMTSEQQMPLTEEQTDSGLKEQPKVPKDTVTPIDQLLAQHSGDEQFKQWTDAMAKKQQDITAPQQEESDEPKQDATNQTIPTGAEKEEQPELPTVKSTAPDEQTKVPYGFWIDKSGNMIPVKDPYGHVNTARGILGTEAEKDDRDVNNQMYWKGYIRAVYNPVSRTLETEATNTKPINTKQKSSVKNFAIENGINARHYTGNGYGRPDDIHTINSPLSDYNRYKELTNQITDPQTSTQDRQSKLQELSALKDKYGGKPPPAFPENHVLNPVMLQNHILSGKATTGTILHSLANTPNHPMAPLAKALLDASDTKSLNVRWNHDPSLDKDINMRSHYDPSTDRVNIGTGSAGNSRVVMEEAIHSMTSKKIPNFGGQGEAHYNQLNKYLKDGKNQHVKDLIQQYFDTAKHLGLHDQLFKDKQAEYIPNGDGEDSKIIPAKFGVAGNPDEAVNTIKGFGHTTKYAMGNLDEFLAQAMKDPSFQRVLNAIPTKDGRTVWQHIVDAVRGLLGLDPKQGSMLDKVLRTGMDIVNDERPDKLAQSGIRNAPPKEQSHTPEELNLPKDKYLGKFGTMTRAVIDKVRDIATPRAKLLANHMQMALDRETELKGKWKNLIVKTGEGLTKFDKDLLQKTFNAEMVSHHPQMQMLTNDRQRQFYKAARQKLDESGKYRLNIGEPVTQVVAKGDRNLYIQRNLRQDPTYFPGMANQKVSDIYRNNTDSKSIAALDKQFMDYNTKTLGMSEAASQERIDNYKKALQGSIQKSNVSHQDYFNAHRKAMGTPLPPSFREQDPVRNLERYFDRAATDASHYEFMEKNPEVLKSLGQTHDAWNNKVESEPNSSLANTPAVKAALHHWKGEARNPAENNEQSISSLVSSAFISGPALEVHKIVSNVVKSLAFTTNPIQTARVLIHGMTNIMNGYNHAVENGVVKLTARSALGMMNGSYSAAERMQSLATAIRKVSTLGDLTTKVGAGLVQSMNEAIIPSKILRAQRGDITSQKFLQRLDPTYTPSKIYTPEEVQQLASRSANYIHGTGDIRSLPAWMLNDSEFSGFFSLAHWSIAQTNNFMKEVYEPAMRGDVKPLMVGLFGSAIGGYLIQQLRQDISGKKNPIPSLQEIAASDKGIEGNKPLIAYNMIAALQYAGFGGLLSQIAKYPFDAAYKNNPQGATFPLDEIATDLAGTLHSVQETIANDPNVNWVDLVKAVGMHTLSSDIQLSRIAINQGIDHGLITGLPAEKKELGDKMNQLRRFDMVEGLPYNDIDEASNPYMNIEQKKFKMNQDLPSAIHELPALISNIFKTYSSTPDVLMQKLKALKENSYQTFPSIEQAPLSFFKYVNYLNREEGPAAATAELQDYLKHKVVNEAKASVVP